MLVWLASSSSLAEQARPAACYDVIDLLLEHQDNRAANRAALATLASHLGFTPSDSSLAPLAGIRLAVGDRAQHQVHDIGA